MIENVFKNNYFVTKSILTEDKVSSNDKYELTNIELDEIETDFYNSINIKVEIFSTLIKRGEKNVILQGEVVDYKIKFMFILNESNGIYIRITDPTKLDELLLSTLKKLQNYYLSWKDIWNGNKINSYL